MISSHAKCILCKEKQNLKSVPKKERLRALKTAKLYIPKDARVCPAHLLFRCWDTVPDQKTKNVFTPRQIEDVLSLALHLDGVDAGSRIDIKNYTGLTDQQFEDLFANVRSLLIVLKKEEKAKRALLMLMIRYRKASTYSHIGSLFDITRCTSRAHIQIAREALTADFVPLHVGFENLSRQFLLQNTTISSRILHCENKPDSLITIWDGTYIYLNKSANYKFQKLTYNGQKKRNFLRPMVCVTTNGYIIDVFGPFAAVDNDAKCMKEILRDVPAVQEIIKKDDVFIFDRGFRDCLEEMRQMEYVVKTPEFIKKSNPTHQLTTYQANLSRLITKNRFVVEARNGHFKTIFPIFDQRWKTVCIHTLGADLRIAAALINKYFQKVIADKNAQELFANAMMARVNSPNILHSIITGDPMDQIWGNLIEIEENFIFPRLTREQLLMITLGTYQLKQAKSYASLHVKNEGAFICYYCPDDLLEEVFGEVIREKNVIEPVLVTVRLASRHISRKKYDAFILADASKNGPSAIIGYCCECICGLRTVGCCSHVATLLHYLCIARYTGITTVASHVDHFFEPYYDVEEEHEEEEEDIEDESEGEEYEDDEEED